jgi:ribosomal protein L44E
VFFEEEAIMRDQQLELIYSQSGLIYKVFLDAPQSIIDKDRHKTGPHADGIVGSTQANPTDPLSNQLQQLSIQQTTAKQTSSLVSPPTQTSDVHSVHSTNLEANHQPNEKKKDRKKKGKGDKKPTNNAGGGNTEKINSNYSCNLCTEDHPTHLFSQLGEAQKLLA